MLQFSFRFPFVVELPRAQPPQYPHERAKFQDEIAEAQRHVGLSREASGNAVQAGGKKVTAFAMAGDLDASRIESVSFEMEWPGVDRAAKDFSFGFNRFLRFLESGRRQKPVKPLKAFSKKASVSGDFFAGSIRPLTTRPSRVNYFERNSWFAGISSCGAEASGRFQRAKVVKLIIAIIKPFKLDDVRHALTA
jgi:hypothetical protein